LRWRGGSSSREKRTKEEWDWFSPFIMSIPLRTRCECPTRASSISSRISKRTQKARKSAQSAWWKRKRVAGLSSRHVSTTFTATASKTGRRSMGNVLNAAVLSSNSSRYKLDDLIMSVIYDGKEAAP
jgi:hypothetical protein